MPRPAETEFAPYFGRYIAQVQTDNIIDAIEKYSASLNEYYTELPEDKADYRYAEGKWTVKEVLQHIIDAERVFAYRVMCIARKDKSPLPSFDENAYAEFAQADKRSFADLKEEFVVTRRSTDILLRSLSEAQLSETGTASGNPVSAQAIAYIVFGHILHHKQVLEERYFNS